MFVDVAQCIAMCASSVSAVPQQPGQGDLKSSLFVFTGLACYGASVTESGTQQSDLRLFTLHIMCFMLYLELCCCGV